MTLTPREPELQQAVREAVTILHKVMPSGETGGKLTGTVSDDTRMEALSWLAQWEPLTADPPAPEATTTSPLVEEEPDYRVGGSSLLWSDPPADVEVLAGAMWEVIHGYGYEWRRTAGKEKERYRKRAREVMNLIHAPDAAAEQADRNEQTLMSEREDQRERADRAEETLTYIAAIDPNVLQTDLEIEWWHRAHNALADQPIPHSIDAEEDG